MSENEELRKQLKQKEQEYEKAKERFKQLKKTIRRNYEGVVTLLTEVISLSDRFLGGHLKRCAVTAKGYSKYLQHPKDVVYLHYYSSLLHDIGLVGKDTSMITLPREQLNESQWEAFELHPAEGEEIIGSIYNLKRTAAIIRAHHERYDGSGFPDHLSGEAIPYGARITALVNDWDILTYKHKLSHEEVMGRIEEESGSAYDPTLVETFLPFITDWKKGQGSTSSHISIEELKPGMYLEEDIVLSNGLLLLPTGLILDEQAIEKLHSFSSMLDRKNSFKVVY
ncbi:MAG: HD domain-containing phosphohydrolase [Spirochaetia bacterium]